MLSERIETSEQVIRHHKEQDRTTASIIDRLVITTIKNQIAIMEALLTKKSKRPHVSENQITKIMIRHRDETPIGDVAIQAAAWSSVISLCVELGMPIKPDSSESGMFSVLRFINNRAM